MEKVRESGIPKRPLKKTRDDSTKKYAMITSTSLLEQQTLRNEIEKLQNDVFAFSSSNESLILSQIDKIATWIDRLNQQTEEVFGDLASKLIPFADFLIKFDRFQKNIGLRMKKDKETYDQNIKQLTNENYDLRIMVQKLNSESNQNQYSIEEKKSLEDEVLELSSKILLMGQESKEKAKEIQNLHDEKDLFVKKIEDYEIRIHALEDENGKLSSIISSLDIEKKNQQIMELNQTIQHLRDDRSKNNTEETYSLQLEIEQLKALIEEKNVELLSSQEQIPQNIRDYKVKFAELQTKNTEYSARIEELEQDLNHYEVLQKEKSALDHLLESSRIELLHTKEENTKLTLELQEIKENTIKELTENLKTIQKDHENDKDLDSKTIECLSIENKKLSSEVDNLKSTLNDSQKQNIEIQAQNKSLNDEKNRIEVLLQTNAKESVDYSKERSVLLSKLRNSEEERNKSIGVINDYVDKIRFYEDQNSLQLKAIEELKATILEKCLTIEDFSLQVTRLQKEIIELKDTINQENKIVSSLNSEMELIKSTYHPHEEIIKYTDQIQSLEDMLTSTKKMESAYIELNEILETKLKEANERIKVMLIQIQKSSNLTSQSINKKISISSSPIKIIDNESKDEENQIKNIIAEKIAENDQKHIIELSLLRNTITSSQNSFEELQEKVKMLTLSLSEAKNTLFKATAENSNLRSEIEVKNKSIQELRENLNFEIEKRKESLKQLSITVSKLVACDYQLTQQMANSQSFSKQLQIASQSNPKNELVSYILSHWNEPTISLPGKSEFQNNVERIFSDQYKLIQQKLLYNLNKMDLVIQRLSNLKKIPTKSKKPAISYPPKQQAIVFSPPDFK